MKRLCFILLTVSLVACSSKVTTTVTRRAAALDQGQEVIVLGLMEDAPSSAIELGTVKIGDTGFSTNCGWDVVIERAKMEARKAGGNVLKVTDHIPPSAFGSTCDRIKAQILKVDDPEELQRLKVNGSPVVDSSWNYAKLYVYRPGGVGALIGYDLYLGDTLLCRVKNNSKQELIINKKGLNSLWAKTESKEEIPIDVEFGHEYYLRCTIVMGVMVGRPQLQLVGPRQGKIEFGSVKGR